MIKQFCLAFLLAGVASPALAEPAIIETWRCPGSADRPALVVASVHEGRETGQIAVAGVEHGTHFGVDGFSRRWNFSLNAENTYEYSFVIMPDGEALYYDFKSKSSGGPKMTFYCSQVGL